MAAERRVVMVDASSPAGKPVPAIVCETASAAANETGLLTKCGPMRAASLAPVRALEDEGEDEEKSCGGDGTMVMV